MMITGYEVGTEIRWNENNVTKTGIIEEVYREPTTVGVSGQPLQVKINRDSPSYLIRTGDGNCITLPHEAVMLKSVNSHT